MATTPVKPPTAPRAALGAAFRARRLELGLTQREVGEFVGKSHAWVGFVEAGRVKVSLEDAVAIGRVLGLSLVLRRMGGIR